MRTLKITIGAIAIRARLKDTPTAAAVWNAAPFSSRARLWGDEVYFDAPVSVPLEQDARDVVQAGEIAFWTEGSAIAIGFGPTPVSRGDEIRLASATNIWAEALDDVRALKPVRAGAAIAVEKIEA